MIIFVAILVFFFHGKEIDGTSLFPKEIKVSVIFKLREKTKVKSKRKIKSVILRILPGVNN